LSTVAAGISLITLGAGAVAGSSEEFGIGGISLGSPMISDYDTTPAVAVAMSTTRDRCWSWMMHTPNISASVIGGAMLPHAPQFFTMPDTEDRNAVERVRGVAAEIGERLRALSPDVWIVFSNDHAEQFFHQSAPPFTIHVGNVAEGEFAGRHFRWEVASELGFELVRQLYRQGFDPAFTSVAKVDYAMGIPLTHLGVESAVLPIYVNAYLPPQPTIERCYAFGQAVARIIVGAGVRAAVVASGGMSHFPGTERYSDPDLRWDSALLEKLAAGNLKSLIGWDEAALDRAGNVELRCWAAAAGALGERQPDIVSMEPSWHHNYASLGFFRPQGEDPSPHYPSIRPDLVQLSTALHGLAHDQQQRRDYLDDAEAYAGRFRLTEPQRAALLELDTPALVRIGVHPLVAFLARMQLERQRKG
jgi:2,3-dihydroxyphenylpropionate 1,2-dioxygenase